MTPRFLIKLRRFFDVLFQSYQSQCACIFNDYAVQRYGKILHLKTQYYIPSRMSAQLSLRYLTLLNKAIVGRLRVSNRATQTEITRQVSPCLDSSILSQFFSFMASMYNFRQICRKIAHTIIYRRFLRINYLEKDPLRSKDQVLGIDISIHGRIPREPVRPRKTVQHQMIGRRSVRLVNRNVFLINRAQGINPELGTFSV